MTRSSSQVTPNVRPRKAPTWRQRSASRIFGGAGRASASMYGLRSSFNIDQVVHEPGPSDPTPTLADTFAFILIVVIGAASAGAWLTDRLIAGYEPWQLALAIVACSVL